MLMTATKIVFFSITSKRHPQNLDKKSVFQRQVPVTLCFDQILVKSI